MSSSSELHRVVITENAPLSPGSRVGDGSYLLNERTSFIVSRSEFPELPWEEKAYLSGPDGVFEQPSSELTTGFPTHLKAWSAYYSSSFYISSCAGRGAHGEVWRGITSDSEPIHVVLKRIYTARGSPSISAAMREVFYGKRIGQKQTFASRYISHFIENDDLWLVFHDEGVSLYQSIFQPTIVGQLSVMTRSLFWRHMRQYSHTVLGHIFKQILASLDRIHTDLHIVHRDIKLENIFIDISKSHIRIGDFGSASPFPKNESTLALFPPNGPTLDEETSRYAPPESVSGDVPQRSPSFDVWCVGIMWLELWLGTVNIVDELCIRKPNCSVELFSKQVKKLDPFGIGFDQDAEMLDLVWRLVSFDPQKRPSAKEILQHNFFSLDRFALATVLDRRREIRLRVSSGSFIGSRSQMEDRLLVIDTLPGWICACIFDGHNGVEVAEQLRLKFAQKIPAINEPLSVELIESEIVSIVKEVDSAIFDNSLVGSTLTCTAISTYGQYIIGNLGDSRGVVVESTSSWEPVVGARVIFNDNITGTVSDLAQDGNIALIVPDNDTKRKKPIKREYLRPLGLPVRVTQITRDHKPDDPIERQYIESRGGNVSKGPPARVQGVLAVSRSVGASSLKPFVRSEVEFYSGHISPNTKRFVLATDGVWDVLNNHQAAGENNTPEELIQSAISAGARDNMAVIFIEIDPDDQCPSD